MIPNHNFLLPFLVFDTFFLILYRKMKSKKGIASEKQKNPKLLKYFK